MKLFLFRLKSRLVECLIEGGKSFISFEKFFERKKLGEFVCILLIASANATG